MLTILGLLTLGCVSDASIDYLARFSWIMSAISVNETVAGVCWVRGHEVIDCCSILQATGGLSGKVFIKVSMWMPGNG